MIGFERQLFDEASISECLQHRGVFVLFSPVVTATRAAVVPLSPAARTASSTRR